MTPAELTGLLAAATPGPWKSGASLLTYDKVPPFKLVTVFDENPPEGHCYEIIHEHPKPDHWDPGDRFVVRQGTEGDGAFRRLEDARLCAALRNLAPLLVELWEAAKKYLEDPGDEGLALSDVVARLEAVKP